MTFCSSGTNFINRIKIISQKKIEQNLEQKKCGNFFSSQFWCFLIFGGDRVGGWGSGVKKSKLLRMPETHFRFGIF